MMGDSDAGTSGRSSEKQAKHFACFGVCWFVGAETDLEILSMDPNEPTIDIDHLFVD